MNDEATKEVKVGPNIDIRLKKWTYGAGICVCDARVLINNAATAHMWEFRIISKDMDLASRMAEEWVLAQSGERFYGAVTRVLLAPDIYDRFADGQFYPAAFSEITGADLQHWPQPLLETVVTSAPKAPRWKWPNVELLEKALERMPANLRPALVHVVHPVISASQGAAGKGEGRDESISAEALRHALHGDLHVLKNRIEAVVKQAQGAEAERELAGVWLEAERELRLSAEKELVALRGEVAGHKAKAAKAAPKIQRQLNLLQAAWGRESHLLGQLDQIRAMLDLPKGIPHDNVIREFESALSRLKRETVGKVGMTTEHICLVSRVLQAQAEIMAMRQETDVGVEDALDRIDEALADVPNEDVEATIRGLWAAANRENNSTSWLAWSDGVRHALVTLGLREPPPESGKEDGGGE